MLRPLLYLSALVGLAGAQLSVTDSTKLNISSYPITFYGKKYEELYVNFYSGNFAVCFDGFFDPQLRQDCIVGIAAHYDSATVHFYGPNQRIENYYRQALPSIKTNHQGQIEFTDFNDGTTFFILVNFETQGAMYYYKEEADSFVITTLVDGNIIDPFPLHGSDFTKGVFDISGCRYSGGVYKPGEGVISDPENCTCDETALLSSVCGSMERCHGDGICMFDVTCTVTGPAVVDIYGRFNSIDDRCEYSLMSGPLVPDLRANFRERRRRDVSFLDSVTLRLEEQYVHIYLEQGGRVLLNDTTLTLNSSAQEFHGVELSKDETGVTAMVSMSNYTTSVFFDGYTAQIRFKGPTGQESSLQGLCIDSSSVSDKRLSDNTSSCLDEYVEDFDGTINCTIVTERCGVLREEPFTTCHNHTDPEPYITACTDTMCDYPAVDGLICQFLEAYARACSLHSNDVLGDWRTEAGCSPPQALCQDRICSDHEFCAETVGGEHACFCRGIFAGPYRSNGTFGEPTVCRENSASITLFTCFLEENGFNYTDLHLNDETCRGDMDEVNHRVTFSFDSSDNCGVVVTTNDTQTIYTNTIVAQNITSDITRQDQLYIDFSCSYTDPDIRTVMSFRIKDSSVIQQIRSSSWNYTLTMTAYTDATLLQAVQPSTEILLDQKIWVELETDGLEGGFVAVVTDSCWATNQASPNARLRYDLITDGCADSADETVAVDGSGERTSYSFSFNMFQFSGHSGEVYLHCQIHLCDEVNESCAPDCSGADRRRRFAGMKYVDEASAFITMSWTN